LGKAAKRTGDCHRIEEHAGGVVAIKAIVSVPLTLRVSIVYQVGFGVERRLVTRSPESLTATSHLRPKTIQKWPQMLIQRWASLRWDVLAL
jgi:hypothetical protein